MDDQVYTTILNAAYQILGNNKQQFGQQFCEGFMFDHDLRNGQGSRAPAQTLFNFVANRAQQLNNGQSTIRDDQQLFDIVGTYIQEIFNRYASQSQANRGGGFGGFRSSQPLGFGGGGGFSQNQGGGMFQQRGGGFGQPTRSAGPSSHLADDTIAPPRAAPAPVTSPSAAPSAFSFGDQKVEVVQTVNYSINPLDKFPDSGVEFSEVNRPPVWGKDRPKDRRIVILKKDDLKTRDDQFAINRFSAYHQLILNDPMEVVRDFFEIVPDDTLLTPYLFKIGYNHLDIIEVPTSEFVAIRQACIDAAAADPHTVIHKTVMRVLGTMRRDPWKALTTYLVTHINRALHLACRLTGQPEVYIRIDEIDDLNELLSSSFQHPFTLIPEGRYQLEKIVGGAIWNALVMNANAMFAQGSDLPTNSIQSSPAFPFSMEGVYPNKYSIPTQNDPMLEGFIQRLRDHELNHRTYVVTRRNVVITNILGKNILPAITNQPKLINSSIGSMLGMCATPYAKIDIDPSKVMAGEMTNLSEEYPSDQLESYYSDTTSYEMTEIDSHPNRRPNFFPVDSTIFAVQYGKKPEEYMAALDVFTTLDNKIGSGQIILAKKTIPTIHTTV